MVGKIRLGFLKECVDDASNEIWDLNFGKENLIITAGGWGLFSPSQILFLITFE